MGKVIEKNIEVMIYIIRGQKVMLDFDLAHLYDVETRRLNEQVRRNIKRFSSDFMFQLTIEEMNSLMSHFATSNTSRGGRRKLPLAFTENGLAMLSGVLNSDRAIEVNIAIMRAFTKLRHWLRENESLSDRVKQLESGTSQLFKVIFERLDDIEETIPILPTKRKRIGIKT